MDIVQKLLPGKVVKALGFTLTDKTINDSFVRGLVFYETSYKGIFISNYDLNTSHDVSPDLSRKAAWIVFGTRDGYFKSMYVTDELLTDTAAAEEILHEFVDGFPTPTQMRFL